VVCTANVCRSPVAAARFAAGLSDRVDRDGHRWFVSSAGVGHYDVALDRDMVKAAATLGLDITDHVPRQVTSADISAADLIVTMTRSQLRTIVAAEPSAWRRTFTLRELARRASRYAPLDGSFGDWLDAAGTACRSADLLGESADDDIDDPFQRGYAANLATAQELERLVDEVIMSGPWPPPG